VSIPMGFGRQLFEFKHGHLRDLSVTLAVQALSCVAAASWREGKGKGKGKRVATGTSFCDGSDYEPLLYITLPVSGGRHIPGSQGALLDGA